MGSEHLLPDPRDISLALFKFLLNCNPVPKGAEHVYNEDVRVCVRLCQETMQSVHECEWVCMFVHHVTHRHPYKGKNIRYRTALSTQSL